LFFDRDVGVESVDVSRQVSLDIDAERVTVRRSGLLEIPLLLEERTDALQMRYRFKTGDGRIDVQVAQAQAGQTGVDEALGQSIDAAEKSSGRIRIPLHGRRGAYVLRIRVNLPTPDSRLLISSLKLVEEGDPTRRPKAANPSLN
jgi:hypothetical protein